MEHLVILSKLEQEYLLHAIEAALPVRDNRQFFLWTQGPLQALLPHHIMVCLQFGAQDELQHVDCVHSTVLDASLRARLSNRDDGLALRLARHCRDDTRLPSMLDAGPGADALKAGQTLAPFQGELRFHAARTAGVSIVIIGLLAAYVGPKYFSQLGKSEVTVAPRPRSKPSKSRSTPSASTSAAIRPPRKA
jgi:hypothetical protein